MVSVKNLCKNYGNFQALADLSFDIGKGDIVAFLGPNGAGKTTTMRIITGFMAPTSGDVMIGGYDAFEEPKKVKAMTGYLPEIPPLYPDLTVYEYLSFVAEIKGLRGGDIRKKAMEVMEQTDLIERKNTIIGLLSKGFRQRVGIAQSIVNSPRLIIMDEPTVGLDPVQVVEIRNLIKTLAKNEDRTVVLSTHILAEAEEICEKAIIIHNGRAVALDTIEHLKRKEKMELSLTVKVRKNSGELVKKLEKTAGVLSISDENSVLTIKTSKDIREDIAGIIVRDGHGLLEMTNNEISLEDIFIGLVR
ncbi:MAG: ABC transporter ATP-binding protein [Brevinematales bacterium]|jgi:ABC-2 type transport system ATP-binding protein